MSWGPKHHVGRWDSNQTKTWLLSSALPPGVHNAPKTRPAPAWIVRLLVGIAAVHIEEPASDREKRESPWKMEAPCAVPDRIGNASREVSRVHGTHTARRDVGPEPSGRLALSAPPPSLRLVAGAHGCTRESEKPRLPFGPSKRREKRWKRRYTHAHARTHARRRAHSAANVRKGGRGMRKCTRAWRGASIVQQQRVVVEPYLLGVDPGGRPLEGRGEGRQAGRHWVDRAGVQAAGLFCVGVW